MKIEKRGKYPGVKVHLEPDEVGAFIKLAEDFLKIGRKLHKETVDYFTISVRIGKKILKVQSTEPDLLTERTPEQVKAALLRDKAKIEAQLNAGEGWKDVN